MSGLQRVPIFISSPSDVTEERESVRRVLDRLNQMSHIRDKYVLTPLLYEQEVVPQTGDFAQMIVDRFMDVKSCHIVVCLFWARMGTPFIHPQTEEAFQSGTEYEFTAAYRESMKNGGAPYVLLYRKTTPSPQADPKQKARVDSFFEKFEGQQASFKGLYKTFDDSRQFEDMLFQHIDRLLAKYPPKSAAPVNLADIDIPAAPSSSVSIGGNMTGGMVAGRDIHLHGEDPKINELKFENEQLQKKLPALKKQLDDARFRARTKQEIKQDMGGADRLLKGVLPLGLIALVTLSLVGQNLLLGLLVGVGLLAGYMMVLRPMLVRPVKISAEAAAIQRLEKEIDDARQQIAANEANIQRLYKKSTAP